MVLRPSTTMNPSRSVAPVRCARSSSRETSSRPNFRVQAPVSASVVASFRFSAESLARQRASVMGSRVTTGRQIIVRGLLILVRTSLVALTGGLVVIRPGLILITRGLVAITRRLIAVRDVIIPLINAELGTAGDTPSNPSRLAAGWALHNLFHHPPR